MEMERLCTLAACELNRRLEAELERLRVNPNNPIATHMAAEYEKELDEIYREKNSLREPRKDSGD